MSITRFLPSLTILVPLAWTALVGADVRAAESATVKRPNIVWIMSEDNSKHYLKHFDPSGVATPAIEALADHGVTFDRAFSNAPVCSVARTTLITGCYGPRIGTQFHRRIESVPLPEGLEMFPVYLRDEGYYTTNNSKTDYNADMGASPWDESNGKAAWSNRPDSDTPFFHVETHTDSHESRMHFGEKKLNEPTVFSQTEVRVPPYLPDTELMRYSLAYYRDRMSVIDQKVAAAIEKLSKAGELENTFVFYFGDHGGVLPRSKGYLFETGLHVPLVVRIPENFRELVDRPFGSRTEGFVSFVDFAPTVLNLAGVELPSEIDGRAYLGSGVLANEVDRREDSFGYADRMDGKYDLVRSVRIGDWKYIRYFEAQYSNSLENEYRYKMLAYQQWRSMHQDQLLTPQQDAFFKPRPVEALFDLAVDPDEVNNLASSPVHGAQLLDMRQSLMQHLKSTHDLSFVPEAILLQDGVRNPVEFGEEHAEALANYIDTVNIAVLPWSQASGSLLSAMNSGDPWVRYWALVAASSMVAADAELREVAKSDMALTKLANRRTLDSEPLVAARAAEFLAILGIEDPRPTFYRSIQRSSTPAEALQILNMAAFVHGDHSTAYSMDVKRIEFGFAVPANSEIHRRLNYLKKHRPH